MRIQILSVKDFVCPKDGTLRTFSYRKVEETAGCWVPSPQCGCDAMDGSDACLRCTADFFMARFDAYREHQSQHQEP